MVVAAIILIIVYIWMACEIYNAPLIDEDGNFIKEKSINTKNMNLKLESLRLIETTSKRQIKNGTQMFHDPLTECDYLSYVSGYVRRKPKYSPIYQLNKTKRVISELNWFPGKFVESTQRIMEMNAENRLEIIANATVNYRNYLKK